MLKNTHNNFGSPDRSIELLTVHFKKAFMLLDQSLDTHGVSIPVLGKVMEEFACSVFDLPKEAACKKGCAYCCHLRVEVSIPELLVIFYKLGAQETLKDMTRLQMKIQDIVKKGNVLKNNFWHTTQTPCPFLNTQCQCLIYTIRPFACRAYHSIDSELCRQGFDNRSQIKVPCFPLYKAATDTFASVFTKVLADKGFAAYRVEFVTGLNLLFNDASVTDQWLKRKDVFQKARL